MDDNLRVEGEGMKIFGRLFKTGREDMRIFGWQFKGGRGGYEDIWVAV